MADEIQVDVVVDDSPLAQGVLQSEAALVGMLEQAQQLNQTFRGLSQALLPAQQMVSSLRGELQALNRDLANNRDRLRGLETDESEPAARAREVAATRLAIAQQEIRQQQLSSQLSSADATYRDSSLVVRQARQESQVAAQARQIAREEMLKTPTSDGRTLGQAQESSWALRAAVTAIDTTPAQVQAQLREASTKAAERLITTTSEALVARLRGTEVRTLNRTLDYGSEETVFAALNRASINREKLVRDFGPGTSTSLGERTAQAQADADYKAYWDRMYADARAEDRQRTLERNRIRREAERENAARDRDYVASDGRVRSEAAWENRERDRQYRAEQARMFVDAVAEDRQRTLERNRMRREAERENLEFDRQRAARQNPDLALRNVRRDEVFANQTGLSRSAWEEQIRRENLSTEQQIAIIQRLRAERERATRDGGKPQLTPEERVAAAWRGRNEFVDSNGGADMFAMQAKLATNYMIFGAAVTAIRGSIQAIAEFDDVLARFQAITGAANSEMGGFREQLLGIAKDSRFSVNELAQVAITLGQTGLSASDVAKALKPVADLAAASGSTLQQSVEAITGVLGAYGMEASRAAEVSDVLVGALNSTKLTMEQLQLGIQYAANIARDSGVSFAELTASIGAIAQAGVKSGSTIGTGVRQLMTELSSPTEKLRAVMKELGLSLADVDLRANGLSGVLENLQKAGFTTADALRSLDLRAAAAFATLAGKGPLIEQLRQEMLLASAASDAAGKANESLIATLQRLQNTAFGVVDKAFSPLVSAVRAGADATANFLGVMTSLGPILPAIGSGLAGIAASMALLKLGPFLAGLAPMLANPVGLAIGGAAAGAYLASTLLTFESSIARIEKRLDQLKGVENELASKRDAVVTTTTDIDRQIEGLIARRDKLNSDPLQLQNAVIEAQKGFGDLGFSMEGVSKSADGLIAAYQRLRMEMAAKLPDIGMQQILANQEKLFALKQKEQEQAKEGRVQTVPGYMGQDSTGNAIYDETSGIQRDPLGRFRKLGPAFDRAMDLVADPSKIDPLDKLGQTKDIRSSMLAEQARIFEERLAEQLKPAGEQNATRLKELTAQYDLAKAALERFARTADLATQLQAAQTEKKRLDDQQTVDVIGKAPAVTAFGATADRLAADRQSDQQAILAAKGLDGKTRIEQMMAALRVTSDQAKDQLLALDAYEAEQVAGGKPAELVKAALLKVRSQLDQIAKNATKELRELIEGLKPEAVLEAQSERRANDAQISALTKSAQTSRDQAEQAALATRLEELTKRNAELSKEILTFGKTPEEVANDIQLKGRVDELDRETAARLDKLATEAMERRRRIEDDVLKLTAAADKAREQQLRAEAAKLEKIARDAQTTPDKARELVEQINKLLDEAKEIAMRRNATEIQRELAVAPGGPLPDSRSAPAGSVAAQVIDGARAAGQGSRVNYLLGLGQLESSMDPRASNPSGAKGLFQFMNNEGGVDTWKQYGKGSIWDVNAQIDAVLRFTKDNAEAFRKAMGREATDAELFVLHNQGAGGGLELLRNPNDLARNQVSSAAVTNNGGTLDMTSAQFVAKLEAMYRAAAKASEKFTTTSEVLLKDKQAAGDRQIAEEDGKERGRVNAIPQIKADQAELAQLRVTDKAAAAEIAQAAMQVAKATEASTVATASAKATAAYGTLAKDAMREDGLDSRNASRTALEKEEAQSKIRDRFRDLAEKEALAAADAAGKITVKVYDQEIDRVQKQLEVLKLDKNENKESQAEIDALDQRLIKLKEARALEGEYQGVKAQIVQLEQSIAQISGAGLGDAEKQVALNQQLLKLKERMALIQPQLELKAKIDNTQPSMENAVSGALSDFGKSRGYLDATGELVNETVAARKLIASELAVIGGSFDNLWTNLFNGSMKAGDALKKFAADALGGLMSNLSKSLTNSIFQGLFGNGSEEGGGFITSILGGLMGKANGGFVRAANGFGVSTRDSVPALLMPGEFVLRKSAVDAIGRDQLESVNALGGQMISRAPRIPAGAVGGGRAEANANVYVVSPDQAPIPGPNDMVHHIADNIQRGGNLKQLIKAVATGQV